MVAKVALCVPEAEVKVDKEVSEPTPSKSSVGKLHRSMGISVKLTPPAPPAVEQPPAEAPPLTLEQLKTYWGEMLEAMKQEAPKLAEQLHDRELRMEGEDMFVIEVSNSYLDSEIRRYLVRMLTYLRTKSGRPLLNGRVEVVYEEKEAIVYSPRDKYDVMLQDNPALDSFRVLFSEVDY